LINEIPKDFNDLNINLIEPVYQLISSNPKKSFKNFFSNFHKIKAAGGIVCHEDTYLFIKRNGKWDIPKGKMEKGEKPKQTAIREIQEECGLTGNLSIINKISKTYHCYFMYGKSVLKKTYWYELNYSGSKSVKAQQEEGISEVNWLSENEIEQVKLNTYSSICEVLECFLIS